MPIEMTPISTSDAQWYYGNQQSVEDFLGTENLRIVSNLEGTETDPNADRILRDGLDSDAEFNVRLRGGVYKSPITVDDVAVDDLDDTHETKRFFQALSDRDVACRLNDHRMIQSTDLSATDLDNLISTMRKEVYDTLAKIKSGELVILADENEEEDSETPGTFESVPIYRTRC